MLLRSVLNPVDWSIDVVSKFCKAWEQVLDTCAGTLASLKAYLWQSEYPSLLNIRTLFAVEMWLNHR